MKKLEQVLKYVEVIFWLLPIYFSGLFAKQVVQVYLVGAATNPDMLLSAVTVLVLFISLPLSIKGLRAALK